MTKSVLILGAGSDMAKATARLYASKGYAVRLAGRSPERFETLVADLRTRSDVDASCHAFDALAPEGHKAFVDALPDLPDVAICFVGAMGQQSENAADPLKGVEVMRATFEGPASVLAHLANGMEARGSGTLVGVSSVAGDRGRATNYVYGSAKAGFTAFLSGLRNRLAKRGVHVVTVKPGFVATAMTEGMDTPKPLTADAQEVADAIFAAVAKGRNIIYVRPLWRLVMAVIVSIPEPIFKKLNL
ncbi:SDR family oxidoreductase [Anianabacter salinae]|uniref:SDR family oxidoreductase n=1 Tax=Anianabacter salinae TaxID=2851023 RepID=UPI00225E6CC8|nr:SDR family oxidoreductase [Anianabacter salinae]MBV0911806.1 SDR family oxidoreductase [Anianabacter salinae]